LVESVDDALYSGPWYFPKDTTQSLGSVDDDAGLGAVNVAVNVADVQFVVAFVPNKRKETIMPAVKDTMTNRRGEDVLPRDHELL
jgi:hypothetical protein